MTRKSGQQEEKEEEEEERKTEKLTPVENEDMNANVRGKGGGKEGN